MKLFLPSKNSSLNLEETCLRAQCDKTASPPCSSAWFLSPVITQIALLPGATERTPNESILRYFSTSINWLSWKAFSLEKAGKVIKVKAYTSQRPRGRSLSWFPGILLLPPGRDASPSHGYPQQYVAGTHSYTWVKRDNVELSSLFKNKRDMRGLKPRPPDRKFEVLTARPHTPPQVVGSSDTSLSTEWLKKGRQLHNVEVQLEKQSKRNGKPANKHARTANYLWYGTRLSKKSFVEFNMARDARSVASQPKKASSVRQEVDL